MLKPSDFIPAPLNATHMRELEAHFDAAIASAPTLPVVVILPVGVDWSDRAIRATMTAYAELGWRITTQGPHQSGVLCTLDK